MDDERAVRLATRHLLDLGHRRIGLIAGWHAAMEKSGPGRNGLPATGDFSFASGKAAALLDSVSSPTAICQPIAAVFSRAVELIIAERRGKAHPKSTTPIEAAPIPRASTSAPP